MCRRLFVSLALVGWMLGLNGVSRAEDDCKAILAKAIQAHGGEEKLSKIHAVQISYEDKEPNILIVTNGNKERPTATYEKSFLFPDKYKHIQTLDLNQGPSRTTTLYKQGKGSVHRQNLQQEDELEEGDLNDIKEQLHRKYVTTRLVSLKDPAYTLSPLAEEAVANKPAVGFKVKAKGYRDLDLFFDKASGLLVKMRYATKDAKGQKTTDEILIKEYQQVDGITAPKKIVKLSTVQTVKEVEYIQTKLLPTMDQKEFDPPLSK